MEKTLNCLDGIKKSSIEEVQPVLNKIDFVSQFDIGETVSGVKKQLESCFDGIKSKLLRQLEDDIRNKIIQNMSSSVDEEYGKINDSLCDINFCKSIGQYCRQLCRRCDGNYSVIPSKMSEINIKKIIGALNLNKIEYVIHYAIIFNCKIVEHNGKYTISYSSGSYELILCTNLCNIFSITDRDPELNIINVEQIIVTNIQLNPIFIDIIKSMSNEYHNDNTPKNICQVISNNIKKYWGTEQLYTDHLEAKKEIESLKLELEQAKKELQDVEMFRQCMNMVQNRSIINSR